MAPNYSDEERAKIEADFAALEVRHPDAATARAHFAKTWEEGEYRVILQEVFASLPAEEAAALFLEGETHERFYAPKGETARLVLARMGQPAADAFEAWGPFHVGPYVLAEMGSAQGIRHLAQQVEDREASQDIRMEAREWLRAHADAALPVMVEVACRRDGTGMHAREWLADRAEAAIPQIAALAMVAPELRDLERFPDGRPTVALRWAARRFGDPIVLQAVPAENRARLRELMAESRRLTIAKPRHKKWPVLQRIDGTALTDEELDLICDCSAHDVRSLRQDLDKHAVTLADQIVDAFVDDKAKPQNRWMLAAALCLSPDPSVRRLRLLMPGWSRSKNRNHRNHGWEVCEWLGELGTNDAIGTLGLWAESLAKPQHRHAAKLALRTCAVDRGVPVQTLLEENLLDLGLRPDGSLHLDFGPRSFTVHFAATGAPVVRDQAGKVRAKLPKPGKRDDSAVAEPAVANFNAVKSDVKLALRAEAQRLEGALKTRRSWTAGAIRDRARHPIIRILAPTLVWQSDSGTFRLNEQLDWTDNSDDDVELPADTSLCLAHPLEVDPEIRDRWASVLADYEIVPPFPQLQREVFRVDVSSGQIDLCADWQIPAGSLMGLLRKGWSGVWKAGPSLAGVECYCADGKAALYWDPFPTSDVTGAGLIWLSPLFLQTRGWPAQTLTSADPRWVSELLRDLDQIRRPE